MVPTFTAESMYDPIKYKQEGSIGVYVPLRRSGAVKEAMAEQPEAMQADAEPAPAEEAKTRSGRSSRQSTVPVQTGQAPPRGRRASLAPASEVCRQDHSIYKHVALYAAGANKDMFKTCLLLLRTAKSFPEMDRHMHHHFMSFVNLVHKPIPYGVLS